MKKIAAILPRYGKNLGGGAEALTRSLLLALADESKHLGQFDVRRIEVWTTCAKDHRTWENAHAPGVTEEDGFLVRRFPVDDRDLETFIRSEHAIAAARPLTVEEQLNWLASGVNSKSLYAHIAAAAPEFDALLFAPYLFPTSFWGSLIAPEKSYLIPCLHNEAYAYLEVFRVVFQRVAGLLFNAGPEQELAEQIFGEELIRSKGTVVGMGFETPSKAENRGLPVKYLLYSGRKEQGKNLDKLLNWFPALRSRFPDLELLLIGSGSIEFMKELPDGVKDLGFVSEEEKATAMAGAIALCQPSQNESFSIVLMEAWQQGTPVLVHADCAVTADHAIRSNGGLTFRSESELVGGVSELLESVELRDALGNAGRKYVAEVYAWPAVMGRLSEALSPREPRLSAEEISTKEMRSDEHARSELANR